MSVPIPLVDDAALERRMIREMLVVRDTEAFCEGDWSKVAPDFDQQSFLGIKGEADPADWRPEYTSLALYRDSWLDLSSRFAALRLKGETLREFLLRSSRIKNVEIRDGRALALKVIEGRTLTADGEEFKLSFQTVYILGKRDGAWKITGFVGYLPHGEERIQRPKSSHHKTAGPYSPVLSVSSGPLVAISGQGPIDAEGRIVGATIEDQTRLTLENCRRQLNAAGASFKDVFKVTVYLNDMAEWERFNTVYREYFSDPFPARTAIQAVLWGRILVEVEMLAAPPAGSASA